MASRFSSFWTRVLKRERALKPSEEVTRGPLNRRGDPAARTPSASGLSAAAGLLAVIHRLSQPLTALHGSLELALLGDRSPGEYRAAIAESLGQADRLVGLLRSLRDLVEAEQPSGQAETVRLNELLAALVADLRPWADSLGLSIVIDLLEEVTVHTDAQRLREALLKVLQKAIERSSQGSILLVSLWKTADNARLEVADEGSFPNAGALNSLEHSRCFGELFSQAAQQGTLEWAIGKRLLETLGATVRVKSRQERGCSILVSFPLPRA